MFVKLDGTGALYQQLYQSLRSAILAGQLAPGTRLPATRAMARELGVSRNTLLLAYEQLLAEGYAVGQTGSGTYVASSLPDAMLTTTPCPKRLSVPRRTWRRVFPPTGGMRRQTRLSIPRASPIGHLRCAMISVTVCPQWKSFHTTFGVVCWRGERAVHRCARCAMVPLRATDPCARPLPIIYDARALWSATRSRLWWSMARNRHSISRLGCCWILEIGWLLKSRITRARDKCF
ncbi:hypothetical protein C2W62_08515 [Candidatus Entotheonella serta]|nr:hypothetical protein C2W62_08515 [Candidatus Entotheonella serta]